MAEDQSVITNENFDSSEANDDKCTQTLDAAKTPHPRSTSFDQNLMFIEAWEHLRRSVVYYKGQAVVPWLHLIMHQVHSTMIRFLSEFCPQCFSTLDEGRARNSENFLLRTLHLQLSVKGIDRFALGQGLMSASFKFLHSFKVLHNPVRGVDTLIADFGETAIGRVAGVDSGFWWIILLHAYTRATGDYSLSHRPECQNGMKLILSVCLAEGFDTFPTLLCADGCGMADRRMGVYGYPIEIQALFFMALRCAVHLLQEDDGKDTEQHIPVQDREYSHTAVNKFNVIPDSIPDWVFDFMPMKGGYFIANSMAILDLIEERWGELVGKMPLKLSYPALDIHGWSIETGSDPKNTRWSYHNGDHGQVSLLWLVTAACIKTGRPEIARKAIELAEQRLSKDDWQEYYDGKEGCYVGKQSRRLQTCSIAGYLVSKMLLEEPSHLGIIALEEDEKIKPTTITRSTTLPTKFRGYP
ncbi:Alkaline/neutral invertase CINV2 [Vitis vinifera]|uniref:Alkaline/neutral invertase n=1 Tax=Vitis vinifera TaxID=29760 RepID=A0A438I201_VITVI|nr:Alkaline/neutral invertase CINV2 [Vitis vinifera]